MQAQDKIRRYNLIIEKIQKSKHPSFSDIQYYLLKQDFPISNRTLQRDIEQIKYQLNISIEYDKQTNGYFIEHNNQSKNILDLLQQKSFYSDLVEFTKANPKHKDAILLDNEMQQPGFNHVPEILFAIRNGHIIHFEYRKFKDDAITCYSIEPYSLKAFENRWYLVGLISGKPRLQKFGLDRILCLTNTATRFKKDKTISIKEHFAQMIGVNDMPHHREIVHLAFTPFRAKYIETLPLHWTQKKISNDSNWVIYEYYLIPNFELEQKILGLGVEVKVLKPAKLKSRMLQLLKLCIKNYET